MFFINKNRFHESYGDIKFGVSGKYMLAAIKPGVGVVRSLAVPNLITNMGMDSLAGDPHFNRMHLGTGTTPPAFTDTALTVFGVNVVNGISAQAYGVASTTPYYGWARVTWTSSVGGATGNWTEIGVSNQNTNGGLRSHALIVDGGGNPTTFPVLADEQFQGVYEFRVHLPASDAPATIDLSGTPYDTITRTLRATGTVWQPAAIATGTIGAAGLWQPSTGAQIDGNCSWYSGGLAAVTASNPLGSPVGSGNTTGIASTYTSGNFYRDYGINFGSGVSVGVVQTLKLMLHYGALQVNYDPTITKLTTELIRHNQRIGWARI